MLVAQAKEGEIAKVLKEYGEERFSKRIARAIVAAREEAAITTTAQLAALVSAAVPVKEKDKHPATRSFQAIRIFINGPAWIRWWMCWTEVGAWR